MKETRERRLAAYREGWNDGRKHGRSEMRRLIKRRLLRLVANGGYDAGAANALDDAAEIVTVPSREEKP